MRPQRDGEEALTRPTWTPEEARTPRRDLEPTLPDVVGPYDPGGARPGRGDGEAWLVFGLLLVLLAWGLLLRRARAARRRRPPRV